VALREGSNSRQTHSIKRAPLYPIQRRNNSNGHHLFRRNYWQILDCKKTEMLEDAWGWNPEQVQS
jgi:hypothetical protein